MLYFSGIKDFPFNERVRLQFRSEIFNILNHPNFNSPGFGGNGVVAIGGSTDFTSNTFGEIGSTRDAPQDRKSTRLNSSHLVISYAVFCLKKKKTNSCLC